MKITDIKATTVTVPLEAPLRHAAGAHWGRFVRTIVEGLDLDCECRSKLDGALQRFQALEDRRQVRRLILDARHQVERIAAFLDFARELDELTSEEPDHSVFEEIAVLFDGMGGQYWRLVTPVFLHFGWLHIAFNCLWLWELGGRVERVMGHVNMLLLFLAIAVVSNVCQFVFGGAGLFGGMSGVVYGLMTGKDPQTALNLGWAHGALLTTYHGDTTMATLAEVEAFASGAGARVQR